MWILGVGGYSHDASACLFHNGNLIAAIQEERLSRVKHQGGFPYKSIEFCLGEGGIKFDDIAAIAFYAKKSNWDRYLFNTIKEAVKNPGYTLSHLQGFAHSVGYRLQKSMNFRADLERFFYETGVDKKTFFCYDHHACHAASAFYLSPFDKALILCVDGGGDDKTITAWTGEGNKLEEIKLGIRHPHSLGLFYTRITKYLGFSSSGDEYKVMGLSAYGKPVYYDKMRNMILLNDGNFRLNMDYFDYQYEYALSSRFYKEFGSPRKHGEEVTEHYANIAASVQKIFEEVLLYLVEELQDRTGMENLCVTGGCSLNCKANGRILNSKKFNEIFVPPAASDLGAGIGAAQYHYHQVLGKSREFTLQTDDWGPEFSDKSILEELQRSGVKYECIENPCKKAAELLADGKIIGWFQGRMEFGPRALGYRSILADPRHKDIKDRINGTIKFREEFRPFAPAVLREYAGQYFNADVDCPFMTYTLEVLPEKRDNIPGIVHVDGSGRLQTVSQKDQPLFYELISEFNNITGIPVVLNTSFNLAGEPIVCSPYDAIRTFYTCGIDTLIMGNYLLKK